jgi:hypothetical protein
MEITRGPSSVTAVGRIASGENGTEVFSLTLPTSDSLAGGTAPKDCCCCRRPAVDRAKGSRLVVEGVNGEMMSV